jgi:hypothetical protein
MLDDVLRYFPAHTHPLTVVHDPDRILNDETILAELNGRGFTVIRAHEPVQLYRELLLVGGLSAERPLILATEQPLNHLPYPLWQQGHQINLGLHTFFPHLAYPVLQSLTSSQRWQLARVELPSNQLGRQATIDFILQHLFGVNWRALSQPAGLVAWLNLYHQAEPMPALVAERWLTQVRASNRLYRDWPLAEWLHEPKAFQEFVRVEWQDYVVRQAAHEVGESRPTYRLRFDEDEQLQDTLPRLVRSGAVQPVMMAEASAVPVWAQVGVRASPADYAQQRAQVLLALLDEQLANLADGRWEDWQPIARTWAELTTWRYHPERYLTDEQQATCRALQERLDSAFRRWLEARYAPLALQILPQPHHLYHVPEFMAYERRRHSPPGRVALLVVDGLSLAAWNLIAGTWRASHPEWSWREKLVLAQVPAITAVSRQALISGRRPLDFGSTLGHNRQESNQWTAFWTSKELPASACVYERLRLSETQAIPDSISSSRTQAACLIYRGIDDLVHGATLGLADVHASLRTWLKSDEYRRLDSVIAELLERRYTVYMTADHGHTEAHGMGQPSEGLTVQTRSKRARIYSDPNAALAVQSAFPRTILWRNQGLLPYNITVLLPDDQNGRRLAFAPEGECVVTHGGLSIDEMVVPLIRLSP